MKVARVAGTVVSTIHHPIVDGRRILLCDLLGLDGEPTGDYVLALDAVDAGPGETVLVLDEGSSARQVLAGLGAPTAPTAPIRAMVVGVVDEVDLPADA